MLTGVLFIIFGSIICGIQGRIAPLIDDDGARKPHRAAECTFGKQIRELGSTWFADLGPPFGVMYCIKCECIPVQKKRRIVAKVQCRNIKNECPTLTCDEPQLLPGRCCKSCPGEYNNAEIVQDLPIEQSSEEEERNLKHFGTLLSGKTSKELVDRLNGSTNNLVIVNYVATGRFNFHRKNLYYSFYLGNKTPRPKAIQFIDNLGSILEEQITKIGGIYQNSTGKLCGVWRRVPRNFRKLLREEEIYVTLVWDINKSPTNSNTIGVLIGQLERFKGLSTEEFSSLLEPSNQMESTSIKSNSFDGSGGTAIISVSSIPTPSIYISVVFNGLFMLNDISDVPITVLIEHQEKRNILLEEDVIIKKPSISTNFGEIRTPISGPDLRLLSRGKLSITLSSKKTNQTLKLTGDITTKMTCDIYQTLLISVSSSVPTTPATLSTTAITNQLNHQHSCGLAWAYIDRYGAIKYGIKLNGVGNENPSVMLIDESGKRKIELEDLTSTLTAGSVANGSLERPGPRILEPLFSGQLSIATSFPNGNVLKGKFVQRPVADAKDTDSPILLTSSGSSAIGLIWLAIDSDCVLYYELELSGLPEVDRKPAVDDNNEDNEGVEKSRKLYLETMPMMIEGAPVSKRLLEEFDGNILEGSIAGLSLVELFRIDSGIGFIEIVSTDDKNNTVKLISSQFKTQTPANCLPHYADNDVTSILVYSMHPPNSEMEITSCFHENKFYDEGTQWTSPSNPCLMCHCYRGVAKCDPIPCPSQNHCPPSTFWIKPTTGHCCPICSDNNSTINSSNSVTSAVGMNSIKDGDELNTLSISTGCTLAGQFHPAGALWHPYLPPSGFDTCAVCICDLITLEVRCPRVQCPPLNCDDKLAVRIDKKACCKQCPKINTEAVLNVLAKDQAVVRTVEDILASGGCKYPLGGPYENGTDWHPKIHSHGEIKCVKCRCRNGEVKCDRKRCPRSLCNTIVNQLKRGIVEADDCCTVQCRSRRHHRNHRNHRRNNNHHHHHHHRHNPSSPSQLLLTTKHSMDFS